jgi:hypothetical protein
MLFSIIHDVTDRKQAERQLADIAHLFSQFFEDNTSVIR